MTEQIDEIGEIESEQKKVHEENSKLLFQQVDSYFQFKKNLLVQEVVFFNRDILENPDVICIVAAECIYNVHTGRLIFAGGSSEGFYENIKERYNINPSMDVRIKVLIDAIVAAKSRNLIEFIPVEKSLQDHLDLMLAEADAKLTDFIEKQENLSENTAH